MLLHCTASTSTFGAHFHHPERPPNLKVVVIRAHPKNLMNRILPWIVRTPPFGYLQVVHQSFCCVQSRINLDGKNFMWYPCPGCCLGANVAVWYLSMTFRSGIESCVIAPNSARRARTVGSPCIHSHHGGGAFTPTPPPLPAGFWLGCAGPWAPKAPEGNFA